VPADTTTLFVEHRGSLVNYANGIVHDRASAEDVVQEAYLRFSAAAKDDQIVNPVSYLYRIVRNLALDWQRRRSVEAPRAVTPVMENLPSDAPSAERVLFYRDELRVISEALAELPERTRIAFRMYRLEGRTLQAIADHLGVSVVRTHQLVKEAIVHAARRLDGLER
jgi:RNA polymerase sigma factor (sigma-70 family)